jgi:hypothetical protein
MNEIFSDTITILTLEIFEKFNEDQKVILKNQLDHLGIESGKAQNLNGPITSIVKMLESWSISDSNKQSNGQTIMIFSDAINKKALGFIKYGRKDLFFYQKNGKVVECSPICLLDFYINDFNQRMGIGLTLFQKFIEVIIKNYLYIYFNVLIIILF